MDFKHKNAVAPTIKVIQEMGIEDRVVSLGGDGERRERRREKGREGERRGGGERERMKTIRGLTKERYSEQCHQQ